MVGPEQRSRRRPRLLVFLSEILSANTLVPILRQVRREGAFALDIVNDGFCREFVESLGLPVEYAVDNFAEVVGHKLRGASLVLMGKSYVQRSEYELLEEAALQRVPVLMVVPDMGLDVVRAKLSGIQPPWPVLLLADERTAGALPELGVPRGQIVLMGNPYFDELYAQLGADASAWDGEGLGYFSTPFELDFQRGILPADYPQRRFVLDLADAAERLGQPLMAKRHPQVSLDHFRGLSLFEGTPLGMIRRIRVALGSYSTTLLEAYAAGVPTISYQPWKRLIRKDVFEGRIPIVRTPAQLAQAVSSALHVPRRAPVAVTANPGRSLQEAMRQVRRWAGHRWGMAL